MRYARDLCVNASQLVGGAAHTPFTSWLARRHLGLLDAAKLSPRGAGCCGAVVKISVQRNLRRYERWRKAEAAK